MKILNIWIVEVLIGSETDAGHWQASAISGTHVFDRLMIRAFPSPKILVKLKVILFKFTLGVLSFVGKRLLALFGWLRPCLFGVDNISSAEEASKEHEVGCVHEERDFNVVVRDVALVASLLHLVGPNIDCCSHNHLSQLSCCDAHCNPAWHPEFEGLEGVVAVHGTVDKVVHADEPAGGGNVVRIGVPGVEEDSDMVVPV